LYKSGQIINSKLTTSKRKYCIFQSCFAYKSIRRLAGLRPPQLGGIYAALSQWTLSNSPKTIVMPTGTGKTETMMGIILSKPNIRPLIVVPSDALREQIFKKFLTLGIFKKFKLLKEEAKQPFVGVLNKNSNKC
jgi:superfamily II DNA or RNA helicase